ncbi:MAG: hypothetical protein DYG86_01020 [Chloroflexi bacterium CFX2]|nr:hypothetical protein [Chloroflexi bacterium CFX2]
MEILLAIVVASAVIFFGALISAGNERQRKAIDGLREQVVLWAVQDLKIKREHLERTVQVADPLGWLNKTASKAYGHELRLQVSEVLDLGKSLNCLSEDSNIRIIFSPLSPQDLRRMKKGNRNRLTQFARHNPLLSLPRNAETHELSVLNGNDFFDLEMELVWQALTGHRLDSSNRIWMYVIS